MKSPTRAVSVANLRANLSRYLRAVQQTGRALPLTDRGRVFATLKPITPGEDEDAWMEMLVKVGIVRAPVADLPDSFFAKPPRVPDQE